MTAAGNDSACRRSGGSAGEDRAEAAPELPEVTSDGLSQALMYLPMGAMAIGMVAVIAGGSASPVLYIGSAPGEDALAANTSLTSLLGIGDTGALEVGRLWRTRAARNRLRVPIGLDARASRSSWTSRNPRRAAWGRTG